MKRTSEFELVAKQKKIISEIPDLNSTSNSIEIPLCLDIFD